jgi:hypothetical protein
MTIYLYKKTHKKTGLQYLGKTIRKDPHKYPGSGVYWKNHLEKHGYDVDTEILLETDDHFEIKKWGKHYSELWNIVESNDWANLKPEEGDGGNMGPAGAKKVSEKLKGHPNWSIPRTEEMNKKLSETKKKQLAILSTEEQSARIKNSCSSPKSWTPERKDKISKSLTGLIRSEKNKLNSQQGALLHRNSLTTNQKQQIYGKQNSGKTWKLINGKRVWLEKEN